MMTLWVVWMVTQACIGVAVTITAFMPKHDPFAGGKY